VQVDQEIEVGTALALIEVRQEGVIPSHAVEERIFSKPVCPLQNNTSNSDYYSPAVLRLAKEQGISVDQLSKIAGTGEGGRVSRKDLENFLSSKIEKSLPAASLSVSSSTLEDKPESIGSVELLKMTGLRKAIAENMVRSFYEAPHASLVSEIDVTSIMKYISQEKERFFQMHGAKLTITSFLVHALAQAAEKFPMLNSSLDKDTIVMKRFVNVGMAVNVEKGLVVPVIKNCQKRDIVSTAKEISHLSNKARTGKLSHEDMAEGTITLTNFGMTGALIGVPIIRYPEVAIIGAGAVQKRVVVREDDSFAVRSMVYVTLTFDHRVIDGIYGCDFLAKFKELLETPLA
jgi:2-oxoglutarate dehydrogenase E2 component (dihydrolipoamide succinyltransferase)